MHKIKNANNNNLLFGVMGLLIGVALTSLVANFTLAKDHNDMMRMISGQASSSTTDHSTMSMADMTNELKDKKRDDFDKAFIEMMIAHHQGAIDMAELIPERAKHAEIKELGKNIIKAQTSEISDMYEWQSAWGYSDNEMNQMMHGGR